MLQHCDPHSFVVIYLKLYILIFSTKMRKNDKMNKVRVWYYLIYLHM